MKPFAATIAALCFTLANPALAQDADGNDTPGSWAVDHYKTFGIWKSICDSADLKGTHVKRCYLRYVDVYSEDPEFAASFIFVYQEDGKTAFQYAYERGTKFEPDGLRVERDGAKAFIVDERCSTTASGCKLRDTKSVTATIEAFSGGGALVQWFTDRHGKQQKLSWSLDGFARAYEDYRVQLAARGLPAG